MPNGTLRISTLKAGKKEEGKENGKEETKAEGKK